MEPGVYVWSDRKRKFILTAPRKVVCPDCGTKYDPRNDDMWWDETGWGETFLACSCGAQFFTTEIDDEGA